MVPRLREYPFQIFYDASNDRINEFYVPALSRSVRFDRIAGFFSSAALAVAAAGIARLIANGGRMRLLCGAQLSEDDVEAVRRGTELKGVVERAMVGCLADPTDETTRARLEALAWMVASGTLEIRVVLPRGRDGLPLAASQAREYFHPKEGIFEDAGGERLAFSGSCNETVTSWQWNYEVFGVFATFSLGTGAAATPPLPLYVANVERRFRDLWTGRQPDWIALEIPEAARQRLLSFLPPSAPERDPLETQAARPEELESDLRIDPGVVAREEAVLTFLREAPFLPNAERIGIDTSPISPWPHQERVVLEACRRYPESFLFSDEVGLGKTIEAGLVLRSLLVTGRVKRALILTPAAVLKQWQEELWEKAALDVARFDGEEVTDVRGAALATTGSPFAAHDLLLASSQLAKRRDRQAEILEAPPWDLVIVDEAHHARRKDFLDPRFRPNRLLELLGGDGHRPGLMDRTRCLYLLTATPMQVDAVEVWDLLRLLRVGGRWQADQDAFLAYYRELRKGAANADWTVLLAMLRDFFLSGGELDPKFVGRAKARLGFVEWSVVKDLPSEARPASKLGKLSKPAREVLLEMAERHTPLRSAMWRSTRPLLRRYRELGLLAENVPSRLPRNEWIALSGGAGGEQALYHRIEEYISDFYRKYESERKGLGFVMTVYRRRLTSSFAALQKSLERRREFLIGRRADLGLTDDDLGQADLDRDISEEIEVSPEERALFGKELAFVEEFLRDLEALGSDSKLARLFEDLREIFRTRETVLIFTQYTDTMDYLRDRLREVYGSAVACFSGRGGEMWDKGAQVWVPRSKEDLKARFREGREVKILLGTESASEGLNLQTCGVLINYDMPWNPMRVEQRIGRIDRIGQRFEKVWVRNYFIEDTVEALVYHRLEDRIGWFEDVVGELQPILAKVSRAIERLSMADPRTRDAEAAEIVGEIRGELDHKEGASIPIEPPLEVVPLEPPAPPSPVTLSSLEEALTTSPRFQDAFRRDLSDPRIWHLRLRGRTESVTFDRAAYDEMPESLTLLTYGTGLLGELLGSGDGEDGTDGGRAGVLNVRASEGAGLSLFTSKSQPLGNLGQLRTALDATEPIDPAEEEASAREVFAREEARRRATRASGTGKRRKADEQLLRALASDVLSDAAYLTAVEKADPDGAIPPTLLGSGALHRLEELGVPFKGLLAILGADAPVLSAESARLEAVRDLRPEHHPAKWEELRRAGTDVLRRWKALSRPGEEPPGPSPTLRWLGRAAVPASADSKVRRFRLLRASEIRPFENAVPVLELAAAAGVFGGGAEGEPLLDRIDPEDVSWYPLERRGSVKDFFVAKVVGRSMDRRVPDGAYCLFQARPGGTRNGQVVLCELRGSRDPETGSRYTVKVYSSEKRGDGGESWEHARITLSPDSMDPSFEAIELSGADSERLSVLGWLVEVVGFAEA